MRVDPGGGEPHEVPGFELEPAPACIDEDRLVAHRGLVEARRMAAPPPQRAHTADAVARRRLGPRRICELGTLADRLQLEPRLHRQAGDRERPFQRAGQLVRS